MNGNEESRVFILCLASHWDLVKSLFQSLGARVKQAAPFEVVALNP